MAIAHRWFWLDAVAAGLVSVIVAVSAVRLCVREPRTYQRTTSGHLPGTCATRRHTRNGRKSLHTRRPTRSGSARRSQSAAVGGFARPIRVGGKIRLLATSPRGRRRCCRRLKAHEGGPSTSGHQRERGRSCRVEALKSPIPAHACPRRQAEVAHVDQLGTLYHGLELDRVLGLGSQDGNGCGHPRQGQAAYVPTAVP